MNEVTSEDWQRLGAWFDELSELPVSVQRARLDVLRVERPALAARLESMLAVDAESEGVLERGLDGLAPDFRGAQAPDDWETRSGQVLGRYRLLEPLGSGGMGEVWCAERADGEYRQQVALKLLKRGMDTQAILRRFFQERSILARLSHPHIVRLLDGGMSDDGRPYYVMERVAGQPLTDYARTQQLSVRARVELIATIADAVGYAHTHLIVHRDLKPSNVVIDDQGVPHLLDFGIAKVLEESGEQTLTGTGMRVLSPAYAAPEQILGAPVGTATDVYALGVMLFELLTGHLPHRRSSRDPGVLIGGLSLETGEKVSHALARSDDAALTKIYGPDAHRSRLARTVAGDLDVILAKALNAEPNRRYAGSVAFADDLRRWLAGHPITARRDSARYRIGKFVRRHRLGVVAAVLVLAALVTGLSVALWQAREARAAQMRAQEQARIATAVSEFLTQDVIRTANPYGGSLAMPLTEALIRAGGRIDERFAGQPRLAGVVHRELADSLRLAGESEAALDHAAHAYEGLRAAMASDDPDLQQARYVFARILHALHRYDEARMLYEEGVAALGATAATRAILPFEVGLAGLDVEDRREDQALATLARIEPAVRTEFGVFSALHVDLLDHRMRAYSQTERDEKALADAHEIIAGMEDQFGVGHPFTLKWLQRKAVLLTGLERYDEALPVAEQACDASQTLLGEAHTATHDCRLRQGVILFEVDRFDEAAALFEKAAAFREGELGYDVEGTWIGWIWLARAWQRQGHVDKAKSLFERVDAAALRVYGPDDARVLPFRQTLGMFLEQTGQLDEAYRLRSELLARAQRVLPEGHVNIAKYAWDLGETLASQQRDSETVTFYEIWLPQWQRLFGDDDSRVVDAQAWLSQARQRLGEES